MVWIVFFCIFFSSSPPPPDVYWGDYVSCTWRWIFFFSRCFRRFLSVGGVNISHLGRWALLGGFRVVDGPSLHLIRNQKVRSTLISNARRYAMKGSFFFLLMKFFTVCFISTFYLKKKCNDIYQVYVFVKDICISVILCVQYVLVTWGNWTCRVGEEWVDSLFFSCKKTHTNSGKTRDYSGCQQFISHKFATDVKMGTDDHVPFYPALLNSL